MLFILSYLGFDMFTSAPAFVQNPACECEEAVRRAKKFFKPVNPIPGAIASLPIPIINWFPYTINFLLITLALHTILFKPMTGTMSSVEPTLTHFGLVMRGGAWGWATGAPGLTPSGELVFGESKYATFVTICKCHRKHNATCNKPSGYDGWMQLVIYIASFMSMVLGGVLLVFELATPLKVTPLGIVRMLVVMVLGILGMVPTTKGQMAMMVLTGMLISVHYSSLSASCDDLLDDKEDRWHKFVRTGIPFIATFSPFVNGAMVTLWDRLSSRSTGGDVNGNNDYNYIFEGDVNNHNNYYDNNRNFSHKVDPANSRIQSSRKQSIQNSRKQSTRNPPPTKNALSPKIRKT